MDPRNPSQLHEVGQMYVHSVAVGVAEKNRVGNIGVSIRVSIISSFFRFQFDSSFGNIEFVLLGFDFDLNFQFRFGFRFGSISIRQFRFRFDSVRFRFDPVRFRFDSVRFGIRFDFDSVKLNYT